MAASDKSPGIVNAIERLGDEEEPVCLKSKKF